jgi:hypothetical protein
MASVAALLLVQGTVAQGAEHAYVGSKDCRKCHIKEYRSWEETKMAQAFELLKPGVSPEVKKQHGFDPDKDYTTDATCLPCHTTGYGKEGGFVSVEETPNLVGVGCEDCHGPGGTYLQDGYMTLKNKEYKRSELVAVGLVHPVGEAQCVTCHNTDNPMVGDDYVFDYEAKKDEGTHEKYPLRYDHE